MNAEITRLQREIATLRAQLLAGECNCGRCKGEKRECTAGMWIGCKDMADEIRLIREEQGNG